MTFEKIIQLIIYPILFGGCNTYSKINLDTCSIEKNGYLYKEYFKEKENNFQGVAAISNEIIDSLNGWSLGFSKQYADIEIKDVNEQFIVARSPFSGVPNSYRIFPLKYEREYVIDRNIGKIVVELYSEGGIYGAHIDGHTIYFDCYVSCLNCPDTSLVRYYTIKGSVSR